jgi:hypothetical protein
MTTAVRAKPDAATALRDARRAIALGGHPGFVVECARLTLLVRSGELNLIEAVDCLAEAADATGLNEAFGTDVIQGLLADAFAEVPRGR